MSALSSSTLTPMSPSSAFPTPTMSHSELSKSNLYTKALLGKNTTKAVASPLASNAVLASSMLSPPMSPHPRLHVVAPARSDTPPSALDSIIPGPSPLQSRSSVALSPAVSSSSTSSSSSWPSSWPRDNGLSSAAPCIAPHQPPQPQQESQPQMPLPASDLFPHDFPPMKSAPFAVYHPAAGTSQRKLDELRAEKRALEAGPALCDFAAYHTGDFKKDARSSPAKRRRSHSRPQQLSTALVSCSWEAVRVNPRAYLNQERALLSNYKRNGTFSSSYTVIAHSVVRNSARIQQQQLQQQQQQQQYSSSVVSSPRKSSRRAPVYYDDSDGVATRSRNRSSVRVSSQRVSKDSVEQPATSPNVLAISALVDAPTTSSSPASPIFFEPIAQLPPIAFATPVSTPEPRPVGNTNTCISFSSINAGRPGIASGVHFVPVTASPRRASPAKTPRSSVKTVRKPRPAPIPSRVHDMEPAELPDYSPPVSSLPAGKSLKVEWKGSPMDLSTDPHVHLLHPAEVVLAATLRLPAELYLDSKKRLFAEKVHRLRQGLPFRRTDSQKACRIDVNKASRLFSAFEKVGWLEDAVFAKYL